MLIVQVEIQKCRESRGLLKVGEKHPPFYFPLIC